MKRYIYILCLGLMALSCSKDNADLVPSDNPGGSLLDIEFALNQGTGIYKDRIQDFYDEKSSVMFYEFPLEALNYRGGTYNENGSNFQGVGSLELHCSYAEEEYVGFMMDMFTNLVGYYGESWTSDLFPRNIYFVDSLYTYGTDGLKDFSDIGLTKYSFVLAGASAEAKTEFVADKPALTAEEVEKLAATSQYTVDDRKRVKFRYDLLWDIFEQKVESGEIRPPQEFIDMITQEIDYEAYNALEPDYSTRIDRQIFLKELGIANMSTVGTYASIRTYYPTEIVTGTITHPTTGKLVNTSWHNLTSGKPIEEKLEDYIEIQFKTYYMKYLFQLGIDYCLNTKLISYWRYSVNGEYVVSKTIMDMLNTLLDKSPEYADVDLRGLLSEETLILPEDSE